jgi:DNA-binding NarL/FixJ family response regulator
MENQPYRIILADDHTLFRQGIKQLIKMMRDMSVIGEAADGPELLDLLKRLTPDMVIMDISMPSMSGIEATQEIKRFYPKIKVMLLTMHKRIEYVHHAFSSGASGYMLKEDSGAELTRAIETIKNGGHYVTPRLSTELAEDLSLLYKNDAQYPSETLTMRERIILQLIAEGKTSKKIAEMLYLSKRTVQNHRFHIQKKLNISSTAELIKYALENGYTDK